MCNFVRLSVETCSVSVPVRGNSKYHYYGLRIKAGSSLLRLMEDQQHLAMRQQPFSQKQRCTAHPETRTCTRTHTLLFPCDSSSSSNQCSQQLILMPSDITFNLTTVKTLKGKRKWLFFFFFSKKAFGLLSVTIAFQFQHSLK